MPPIRHRSPRRPPVLLPYVALMVTLAATPAGAWEARSDDARRALVVEELEATNIHLEGEIRRQKLDAMAPTVFTFLRGSAALYHRDLLDSAALGHSPHALDNITWLQGDAHVRNVGVFANDQDEVVFDFDDFDQAWPGSYLVDVWRMATSLRIFAGEVGVESAGDRAVRAFAASYAESLRGFAGGDDELNFQLDRDRTRGPARRLISETLEEEGSEVMLKEWTRGKNEKRRFRNLDDLDELDPKTATALMDAVASYAKTLEGFGPGYFRVKDVARRLKAGLGSRGVDRFYVLLEGPEGDSDVILDVKAQAPRPSLSRLFEAPSTLPQAGCRVALAEKALLAQADDHLGCLELLGQSFSVRRRNPYKKSMKAKKVDGAGDLEQLAQDLGRVMAAAHARADDDFNKGGVAESFDEAFAAKVDSAAKASAFVEEVLAFSAGYRRQMVIDYGYFLDWREGQP